MTYALVERENIDSKQIFDTFEDLVAALPEDTSNYDIEVLLAGDEELDMVEEVLVEEENTAETEPA